MPVFRVKVKWGKQKFDNVEVDTDETPEVFKMQLFSLTGVSPDRQKVMFAGVTLNDQDWGRAKAKIKNNATLLMMGSADELPSAPAEPVKFLEDMSESEAAAALLLPLGLENFGNTCYMNATLQCLKRVPELRDALSRYTESEEFRAMPVRRRHTNITGGLNLLYGNMDKGKPGLPLYMFMEALHELMPHFAERDDKTNSFRQQDAHECWSAIMSQLAQTLKMPHPGDLAGPTLKFMDQYFGVEYLTKYKCVDSPEEQETSEAEKSFQISCFISQDTKYTHTGLKKGLEGTIEKMSPTLNVNATYKKVSRVSRLPGYLTVQYMRFFVGKAADSEEVISKKILKDIKYQLKLDMYEFCTPELQKKLLEARNKFKDVEEKKALLKAKAIAEGKVIGPRSKQQGKEERKVEYEPYDFPDDPGSNSSGNYELIAVLTHKGRSSSSGHYLGWVRHRGNEWLKMDDDMVSVILEEDVLKLSGGGDWHMAYILLYGPAKLEVVKDEEESKAEKKSEDDSKEEPMDTQQAPSTESS